MVDVKNKPAWLRLLLPTPTSGSPRTRPTFLRSSPPRRSSPTCLRSWLLPSLSWTAEKIRMSSQMIHCWSRMNPMIH